MITSFGPSVHVLWDETGTQIAATLETVEAAERVLFLYKMWQDVQTDAEREAIGILVRGIPQIPFPKVWLPVAP